MLLRTGGIVFLECFESCIKGLGCAVIGGGVVGGGGIGSDSSKVTWMAQDVDNGWT